MTTPSDQDVASACRWLSARGEAAIAAAYPGGGLSFTNRIIATARALGWTPSPSAPVFTEAEVLAAMEAVRRDIATRTLRYAVASRGEPKPYPLAELYRIAGVDLWNECIAGDNDGHHSGGADKPLDLRAILNRIRGGR